MWNLLDKIGTILGLLAFIGTTYSALMWMRQFRIEKRMLEAVAIRLVSAKEGRLLHELPYKPARRLITRSEVLGLLGMIPSRQQRFDWRWLHEPDFMRHLEAVYRGERCHLEIPVTDDEFSQLDLPATTSTV